MVMLSVTLHTKIILRPRIHNSDSGKFLTPLPPSVYTKNGGNSNHQGTSSSNEANLPFVLFKSLEVEAVNAIMTTSNMDLRSIPAL